MSLLSPKSVNPFEPDIFELDSRRHRAASQESVYQPELDELAELIRHLPKSGAAVSGEEAWGAGCGLVLLRSRRAGFGKTHFLDSLTGKIGDAACLVSLKLEPSSPLTWAQLLRDTLSSLHAAPAWDGRLNALEDFSRRLFSDMTRELLLNGGIPCANPVQTVAALEKLPPQQVFDFANTSHAIGKWFSRYFEAVLPAARGVITAKESLPAEDAGLWLTRLYAYNQPEAAKSGAERLRRLLEPFAKNLAEERARELFSQFSHMLTRRRPLVFVVDEIDAFFSDQAAIKSLGALLLGLARQVPQAMVLLSVNEDLWQSGFSAQLPSAWEDRLTAHVVELNHLPVDDAYALLEQRLLQAGIPVWEASQFLDSLDLGKTLGRQTPNALYPRAVIRHAAAQWRQWKKTAHSRDVLVNPMPRRDEMELKDEDLPEMSEDEPAEGSTKEAEEAAAPVLAPLELEQEAVVQEEEPPVEPEESHAVAAEIEVEPGTESEPAEITEPTVEAQAAEPMAEAESIPQDEFYSPAPAEKVEAAEPPPAARQEDTEPPANEEKLEEVKTIAGAGGAPPFNRLRDMLERLRQSRGEGNVEAMFKEAVSEKEATPAQELSARYHRLREEFNSNKAEPPAIRSQDIAALLKVLSQGHPVVGYYELDLPTLPGKKVIRWTLEDREILFGCEPSHEVRFWKLLSDFTARRVAVREGQGKQSHDSPQASRLKLVLPNAMENGSFDQDAWLRQIEAKPSVSGALHVLSLDGETQARLLAASKLIQEISEHKQDVNSTDLISFLSKELGDFWQQITSPLQVEVEQMA